MDETTVRLSEFDRALYQRNILLKEVGEAGQLKLMQSRVLIIGLGGLGSPALYYLAAAGIGEIGIADSDWVDLSNLQRQILHGREDVGRQKTLSAQNTITKLSPDIRLNRYPFRITEENGSDVVAPYDFVIEATDNFSSKFLINDVCVKLGKPFSHAGILGAYGQAMTVMPGKSPCFRCVFQTIPPPDAVETADDLGVLGTVAGVFGCIQATEAIKYLLGRGRLLTGRLLTWDLFSMTFREIELPRNSRCEVCGGVSDE
jgi:molybdopterin/thiamine biosynthesis adenylyltransferase